MDVDRFASLAQTLLTTPSRRAVTRGLTALMAGSILAPLFGTESEAAKRGSHQPRHRRDERDDGREQVQDERGKKKKKRCAKAGQTPGKKRKRCCRGLVRDGSGACQAAAQSPPRCTVCADGCPYPTVQAAVADASGPSTITLCPGTYTGNVTINRDLSLIGAGDGAGPGDSILQGTFGGRVVAIGAGITATLQSVRITGGGPDVGAGILNEGDLTLTDCTLIGNDANGNGGGIYNTGDSTLALTGCTITMNTAGGAGGGIYNSGFCTIKSSSVTFNESDSFGGGLSNSGSLYFNVQMTLTNVTVSNNTGQIGGGIDNQEMLTLNACTLEYNIATTQGGGLDNWSGTATLNDSLIFQNGAPDGGGIFERAGSEVVLNTTEVKENSPNNCAPASAIPSCTG
jgi:parallel beta-helix repeat protein